MKAYILCIAVSTNHISVNTEHIAKCLECHTYWKG